METPAPHVISDTIEWCRPSDTSHQWYKTGWLVLSAQEESLDATFDSLRKSWHREYGMSSSFTQITHCPSYRKIVQLGDKVLPLIFRDLEQRAEPDYWFDALVEITKTNPVSDKDRGYSRRMAKTWLKWARANRKYA